MDVSSISDLHSLRDWLKTEREPTRGPDALWIASRAVARVVPFALSRNTAPLVSLAASEGNALLLKCFRCLMISSLASTLRSVDFSDVAEVASEVGAPKDDLLAEAFLSSADAVLGGGVRTWIVGTYAADTTTHYDKRYSQSLWRAIRSDANSLLRRSIDLHAPLWEKTPEWFAEAMAAADRGSSIQSSLGEFWQRWFGGLVAGKPMDPNLQQRVVRIGDAIWRSGPVGVREEILRIEQLMALEAEAATLEQSVEVIRSKLAALRNEVRARREGEARFGDNGGPPLEEIDAVASELDVVAKVLPEVQTTLGAASPDRNRLHTLAATLLKAGTAVCSYLGSRGDLLVTEMIKGAGPELGKWGVRVGVGALALGWGGYMIAPDLVQQIIDFALKLKGL